MRTIKVIGVFVVAMVLFASCEKSELSALVDEQAKSSEVMNGGLTPEFTTTVDDLTQADRDGLLLMLEEEKLAHDVYVFFFGKFGLKVFDNISKSEAQHNSAVLALITHFDIANPSISEAGVFTSPEIQTLYNQLIAAGTTVEEALKTGAYIEEYDIADLNKLLSETKNADINMVYSNLLKGSENHLKAFSRSLLSYGLTYEPQILSIEEYEEIIASNNNGGKGAGNQAGAKQGYGVKNGAMVHQSDSTGVVCDSTGTDKVKTQPRFQNARKNSGRP